MTAVLAVLGGLAGLVIGLDMTSYIVPLSAVVPSIVAAAVEVGAGLLALAALGRTPRWAHWRHRTGGTAS